MESCYAALSISSPQNFARAGASVAAIDDVTGDGQADIMVGVPEQDVNGLINAGETLIFDGASGSVFQTLTSETPQAYAGFGSAVTAVDFNGDGSVTPVIGVPYQNANLVDPDDGDLDTHLQIGQIEIQQKGDNMKINTKLFLVLACLVVSVTFLKPAFGNHRTGYIRAAGVARGR